MNFQDERKVDPINEMFRLTQSFLSIGTWGFRESYRSINTKKLIYDSEFCRLGITWEGWDPIGGNSISIYYGRLHAPSESSTMFWNGENCYVWHRFEYVLHLLDGRSPSDASNMDYSTPLLKKYHQEEFYQKYNRRQPEWLMTMHKDVWQHYGNKFFELFDLRRPDLWEQYRKFLKDIYDIQGRIPFIKPPMDKVC